MVQNFPFKNVTNPPILVNRNNLVTVMNEWPDLVGDILFTLGLTYAGENFYCVINEDAEVVLCPAKNARELGLITDDQST